MDRIYYGELVTRASYNFDSQQALCAPLLPPPSSRLSSRRFLRDRPFSGTSPETEIASNLISRRLVEPQRTLDRHGVDVFHHELIRPTVEQRADVRMVECREGPRLVLEALGELIMLRISSPAGRL